MYRTFITRLQGGVLLASFLVLTACGGNSSSEQVFSQPEPQQQLFIKGAGIKGPLAFADAKVFAFDPSFPGFYDENSPLSVAISNEFAEITGLSVPGNVHPLYIMTIGGANAIDLNTGKAPVIPMLITVITADMLTEDRPIYATPLTTLVFDMARFGTGTSGDVNTFIQSAKDASILVSRLFALAPDTAIDVFKSPLVINDHTISVAQQQEAVHHRAALEAFAAKINMLASSHKDTTANTLIERLARDIQSDGVIDNSADGETIGGIDPAVLNQDPMDLQIPNTVYRIGNVMDLMEDERISIGTDRGPDFQIDAIEFGNNQATPEPVVTFDPVVTPDPIVVLTSFPVDLRGNAPQEASISINISKPAGAVNGVMTLTTYDADFPDEGELIINGNTPVALFGTSGVSGNDQNSADITITTPASYWKDGANDLFFRHTNTHGYIIDDVTVSFEPTTPVEDSVDISYPTPMGNLASTLLASGLVASGPIVIKGESDIVISGKHITNPNGDCIVVAYNASNITIKDSIIGPCGKKGISIHSDSHHVTVTGNYIHDTELDAVWSYEAYNITVDSNMMERVQRGFGMWTTPKGNLSFTNNFVKNIIGGSVGNGAGGNVAMAAFVRGPGIRINNNIAVNVLGESSTEDLINLYKSSGKADDPIQVNNNKLLGGGPSLSGGGIILGDSGGSYQEARNNILVNPGMYGISISAGRNMVLADNKVFSDDKRSFTNGGMIIAYQALKANLECSNLEVSNNEITFWQGSDFLPPNTDPYLLPYGKWGNCGAINGWKTNKFDKPGSQPANLDETIMPAEIRNHY